LLKNAEDIDTLLSFPEAIPEPELKHFRVMESRLGVNGLMLSAIRFAWQGEPWDNVEVLTGKSMKPTPGMKKTILLGKCIYQAHKDNPDIQEAIPVKGCPPKPRDMLAALQQAGIDADPGLFENIDQMPGFFMSLYKDRPEYEEAFFRIK